MYKVKEKFKDRYTKTIYKENHVLDLSEARAEEILSKGDLIEPAVNEKLCGEIPTGGDTLTWDGNTEGLASVEGGAYGMYKVSDLTPNTSEFNSFNYVVENPEGTMVFSGEIVDNGNGVLLDENGTFFIIFENGVGKSIDGVFFPESGIYFMRITENVYGKQLTLNGYTGFPSVKRLDEKYMPLLTSPNGSKYKLSVSNDGVLSTECVYLADE